MRKVSFTQTMRAVYAHKIIANAQEHGLKNDVHPLKATDTMVNHNHVFYSFKNVVKHYAR